MEGSTSSIIFIALITTLLVVFNYRTMRFKKNVADIVQQILAHNKRDRMLRNQEFVHYFLSSGNIWLAHMDADFRKTVMVQTGVSVRLLRSVSACDLPCRDARLCMEGRILLRDHFQG